VTGPGRKPLKTTCTEAQVLAQVLEAARMLGIDLARQNTGGLTDARGQYVAFGTPGNPDTTGTVPSGPNKGLRLDVEVKREGFDPARARGEERERFERQLARLKKTNEQGGIGFWVDDPEEFLTIMRHVLAGARVEEPGYGRPVIFYPAIKE
jgi:hypothetical protein